MNDLKTSNKVAVSIGSNIEQEKNITAALDALEQTYGLMDISVVYKSRGYSQNPDNVDKLTTFYLNLVVTFKTIQSIAECKKNLRNIEKAQGRQRNSVNVTCDLDLLLYNDACIDQEEIKLPHPDITSRDYVLRPLADIWPNQKHPILTKTYSTLWKEFSFHTELEIIDFCWNKKLISSKPIPLSL